MAGLQNTFLISAFSEDINERRSSLRSASSAAIRSVELRRTPYIKFGDRAFCVACRTAWNNLPDYIKLCTTLDSFKRQLDSFIRRIISYVKSF